MQTMSKPPSRRESLARFRLLDSVSYLPDDSYGYYRILVTSPMNVIKYLRFHSDARNLIPDYKGRDLAFDRVPQGSWNCASLAFNPAINKYDIISTGMIELRTIPRWHEKSVEMSHLPHASSGPGEVDSVVQCEDKPLSSIRPYDTRLKQYLRTGNKNNDRQSEAVFVDCSWYPSDIYGAEKETRIHARIRGHQIAPEFLAHVTENHDRIIGYMTEHVPGRAAEPSDLAACQAALAKLHRLGIAYGELSASGFLVADDPRRGVLLHSFGAAKEVHDEARLKAEMKQLGPTLEADAKRRRRERRGNRM